MNDRCMLDEGCGRMDALMVDWKERLHEAVYRRIVSLKRK